MRAANARLRQGLAAKDSQITALPAALEAVHWPLPKRPCGPQRNSSSRYAGPTLPAGTDRAPCSV